MALVAPTPATLETIRADLVPEGVFWRTFYDDLIQMQLYAEDSTLCSFLLSSYRTGRQLEGAVFQFHALRRVACSRGTEAVGIVTVSLLPKDHQLVNLYVKPEYRHQGHGHALLTEAKRHYAELRGVYTDTSQHLYRALDIAPCALKAVPSAVKTARYNLHARPV